MSYEPHGRIHDIEDSWNNPWVTLIGWIVIILCVWYKQSIAVKNATYKKTKFYDDQPVKMKMSFPKWCYVVVKCLVADIKENPRYTLACCGLIVLWLINCLTS